MRYGREGEKQSSMKNIRTQLTFLSSVSTIKWLFFSVIVMMEPFPLWFVGVISPFAVSSSSVLVPIFPPPPSFMPDSADFSWWLVVCMQEKCKCSIVASWRDGWHVTSDDEKWSRSWICKMGEKRERETKNKQILLVTQPARAKHTHTQSEYGDMFGEHIKQHRCWDVELSYAVVNKMCHETQTSLLLPERESECSVFRVQKWNAYLFLVSLSRSSPIPHSHTLSNMHTARSVLTNAFSLLSLGIWMKFLFEKRTHCRIQSERGLELLVPHLKFVSDSRDNFDVDNNPESFQWLQVVNISDAEVLQEFLVQMKHTEKQIFRIWERENAAGLSDHMMAPSAAKHTQNEWDALFVDAVPYREQSSAVTR